MREKNVKMAEKYVTDGSEALCSEGIGSCVAVFLFENDGPHVGIAHVALPSKKSDDRSEKYADNILEGLIKEMKDEGVDKSDLAAKIFGGAQIFDFSREIGVKNVDSVRKYLETEGIPIISEDTGGEVGRSVKWKPDSENVEVRKPFEKKKLL